MKSTALLIAEHRLIERALLDMRQRLEAYDKKNSSSLGLDKLIDFLGSYADLCHHGKEENILFLECELKNLSADLKTLMEELRLEHIGFRKMREKMCCYNSEFVEGNYSSRGSLNELIENFYLAFKNHTAKEESVFFPQVMKLFNSNEEKEIFDKFSDFDSAVMHERYRQLVGELGRTGKAKGCLD